MNLLMIALAGGVSSLLFIDLLFMSQQDLTKTTDRNSTKLGGGGHGPKNKPIIFGINPHWRADPGIYV